MKSVQFTIFSLGDKSSEETTQELATGYRIAIARENRVCLCISETILAWVSIHLYPTSSSGDPGIRIEQESYLCLWIILPMCSGSHDNRGK
jgi:hypothetical protein